MTADAIIHNHFGTGFMSLNDLRLAFGKKCSHVFHTVPPFKGPFFHSNFDHHSHGGNSRAVQETVDFSFNRSYDVSGQKTAHIHHHDIVIPANATAGDYHLMVYCTDAAGNESYIARNIKLSNEVEDEDHHHNE